MNFKKEEKKEKKVHMKIRINLALMKRDNKKLTNINKA